MTVSTFVLQPNIALLTKHGKADMLAPAFKSEFNANIEHTDAFDTDALGSFDHAIARTLSPAGAALKKAYLACELTGCSQGLGSEGSFQSYITGATINKEVIAFVDVKQNIEVLGFAEQFIGLSRLEIKNEVELGEKMQPFIEQFGDEQKWMLLQQDSWLKGLNFNAILEHVITWPCCIEPDFRAMNCPPRQVTIKMAVSDLIRCLKAHCPQCQAVNFVAKHTQDTLCYLNCELCGSATTKLAPAPVSCDACGFIEKDEDNPLSAAPMYCTVCNP